MATIKKDGNIMALPLSIKRGNPIPLDATEVFYTLADAQAYAASDPTAYVGQGVKVVDETTGKASVYIIQNTSGTLKKLVTADDLGSLETMVQEMFASVGFQGSLNDLITGDNDGLDYYSAGAEFIVDETGLAAFTATNPVASSLLEVGDYIIAKDVIQAPYELQDDTTANFEAAFVILEQNLTGALVGVQQSSDEVSYLRYINYLGVQNGKIVVYSRAMPSYKQAVEDFTLSDAGEQTITLAHAPLGSLTISLNGLVQKQADFSYNSTNNKVLLAASMAVSSGDVVTAQYLYVE